jgi:hypothetical protein
MAKKTDRENLSSEENLAINREEFNLFDHGDFPRVDNLCRGLLLRFYQQLQEEGLSPEEATVLANDADYFVRDFIVDFKAYNLFDEAPDIIRQFAGNWFITRTLEPHIGDLARHLEGIRAFYRFLHGHRLISPEYLRAIEKQCDDLAYYENRIVSYWEIEGDGCFAWERECSLKDGEEKQGRA